MSANEHSAGTVNRWRCRDTPAGLAVILCCQRFKDPLAGNLRRLGAVVYGNHNI